MRPHLARFIVTNEDGVKVLVVVGEVSGSSFGRRRAIARSVLSEIGDRQFRFAGMVFQEIFQFGRSIDAGDLGQGNLGPLGKDSPGGLRGKGCRRGANGNNPENRIPDKRAHLGCLYLTFTILSRNYKLVMGLSHSVRWRRGRGRLEPGA